MGKKRPGWLDKPELAWTPETPLRFEPKASTEFDSGDNTASTHGPKRWRNQALWRHKTTSRLALGLMQGLLLSALLYGRDHHRWADTGFTAGLIMAMIFAPLLLIQGLGRISPRPLLIWAASVAIYLTGFGAYHHWRGAVGSGPDQAGLWLAAMVAAVLFIGQSLFLAQARGGRGPLTYPALFEAAWGLGIQTALCCLCAAGLWALQKVLPVVGFVVIPIITVAVAAISQLANRALLRRLRRPLVFALTCALPALVLLSVLMILLWSMTRWLPPFGLLALVSLAMVVSINASYRDGEWRPGWRRRMEFAAALLLLPLATLCILALQSRVAALGFTMPRVVAAALVLLLLAYALAYAGATLITLTGGRAMERLEIANLAIAFMAMSVMTAMASPLADPVRLAVAEQSWRLTHGAIAPAKFDYAYLRNSGLRFGHEALQRLHAQNPQP